MLADPMREKIMNALADSALDCAQWNDEILGELTDLVLNVIIEELSRGVTNAKPC